MLNFSSKSVDTKVNLSSCPIAFLINLKADALLCRLFSKRDMFVLDMVLHEHDLARLRYLPEN